MNTNCNNWGVYVYSVVFAINNSVNASLGYSPFDVVFAQRPKFPLVVSTRHTFQTLPKDIAPYIESKQELLPLICDNIYDNLVKYKDNMISRANTNKEILKLSPGDYVYHTDKSSVSTKKLGYDLNGLYIVDLGPELECLLRVKEDLSQVLIFQDAKNNV